MKKMMSLFLVFNLFAGSVFAENNQDTNTNNTNNNNNNNRVSPAEAMQNSCNVEFESRVGKAADGDVAAVAGKGIPAQATPCDYLYVAALVAEAQIKDSDTTPSSDGSITCVQKFGYTVDYDACKKSVKLYNYVLITEKAMQMQQGVRQTVANNKIAEDVKQKSATGDGQTAAWEATIKTNKNLANLNKEQAAVYSASVSALSSAVAGWPGATASGYKRVCKGSANVFKKIKEDKKLHPSVKDASKCPDIIANAKSTSKGAVFANENAKGIIGAKITEFVQKGLAAGINAAQLGKNAANMQNYQNEYEDPDMLLDRCVVNPTSQECMAPNVRGDVQAYQGGSFSMGTGTNTDNAFNNTSPTDGFGIDGVPTTTGSGPVSDIKSPFEDEAKIASGILDPSAAATITPGSGAAAGAGGGGGGGGGGGSASLGDDIQGAEAAGNKEAEIKSSKFSGGYASNGGGGFQAIKGSGGDDEANPLAGLVDATGGVEEDRSIASEGIDGQDSGLFQKISNKYSQIQNEKRIEASNLE